MRYLQEIILSLAMGFIALEIIPFYGETVSGLFGQATEALERARGRV